MIVAVGNTWAQEDQPPPTPTPAPTPLVKSAADDDGLTAEEIVENPDLEDEEVAEALLNPYPEHADKSLKEKYRMARDAVRGLAVWDLFDGRLTIRGHARLQVDGTYAEGNSTFDTNYGEPDNGADLRRLQVFAQGTIDDHLRYSASFSFGADPGPGEIFVEGRHEGLRVFGYDLGQFRVGYFQEPFSFERVMSSYHTSLLERALPVWTFTPGNNVGYMLHDTAKKERMSWALGFFSFGQTNEANASNSNLSVTGRLTGLPIFRDDGRRLLHLGASYSTRDPRDSATRYRSRPEARFVDHLIDTGDVAAGKIRLYGVEVVGVHGPWSFQSELIASDVSGIEGEDHLYWGAYVQVGFFITGDHRTYDRKMGVFSRMQPLLRYSGSPFKGGFGGAWEVVGRISKVDLNDGSVQGGKMLNYSVGLNWYLSPTSALKLNVIHADVYEQGKVNTVSLRYQFRPLPIPGWK